MTTTLCFKDVFGNYEKFKEYTDTFGLYQNDNAVAEIFNQNLFYNLYNRYVGCSLAYDTVDLFLAEFGIAYQQYFNELLRRSEVVNTIHRLSLDEMSILQENIANFSNNPNAIISDPWALINYTTTQSRGRSQLGKLPAYLNALRNMPDAQWYYILGKFDYMWLDIIPSEEKFFF